ncbi:hypothetical protein QYF61_009856 [Mycteria americana]|uniref:Keratin n=1 Tax=Mycteria americana TaxID=33587 RepID=A0AAN7NDQ5_MYCAM|nr:hypothetical protein QYF61_009856 [Mycteria americana]
MKGRYKSQPESLVSHLLLLPPSPLEPAESEASSPPLPKCISSAETCRVMTNACHASPVARPRWPTAAMSPVSGSATTPPLSSSPLPWWCDLPGPILSSFPQNTVVGSSTSAAVGNILSCDGVPITSGCCDLPGISSRYYGRRRRNGILNDTLQSVGAFLMGIKTNQQLPVKDIWCSRQVPVGNTFVEKG